MDLAPGDRGRLPDRPGRTGGRGERREGRDGGAGERGEGRHEHDAAPGRHEGPGHGDAARALRGPRPARRNLGGHVPNQRGHRGDGPGRGGAGGDPRPQDRGGGRRVLASERTGDERQWDKDTRTVDERGTGKRLGSFRSHLATVPFLVQGARAVFETGPFSRRVGEGIVSDPPKLHSVDLGTGKEVWSRAVGETNYRGPSPP